MIASSVATEPFGATEITGTAEQSNSPARFRERQYRLTASKYKEICLLGEKIIPNHGNERASLQWKCFRWLSKTLWFPKFVQTKDLKYGITEETKAREAYSKATDNKVETTGLWVNKKFPFLAASPDGVANNPGNNNSGKSRLTEMKCLKLLRETSV